MAVWFRSPNGSSGKETCQWGAVSFDGAWGGPVTYTRSADAAVNGVTAAAPGCGANPRTEGRGSGLEQTCPCWASRPPGVTWGLLGPHTPPAGGCSWASPELQDQRLQGAVWRGLGVRQGEGPRAVPQEGTQTLPRIQPPAFPEGEERRVLQGTSLSPRREHAVPSLVYDQHTRCKPSSNWCFYFHQAVFTFLRAVTVYPSFPPPLQSSRGLPPARLSDLAWTPHSVRLPQRLPLRGLAGNTPIREYCLGAVQRHSRRFYS